jgi:hypothetical protein
MATSSTYKYSIGYPRVEDNYKSMTTLGYTMYK